MTGHLRRSLWALLALVQVQAACATAPGIVAASKKFTESVILGEILTQLARARGAEATHRRALGGTRLLWNALRHGAIDLYPEYTGTLGTEVLGGIQDPAAMRKALARIGIRMSAPLGFNNTYALGMREPRAAELKVERISDLVRYPDLRFGFSEEFMERLDGWPGLRRRYGLPQREVRGLDHDLAYRGLAAGTLDATDLYTTDPEIRYHQLRVLADDRAYFPDYQAVVLYRADLDQRAPRIVAALEGLSGRIDSARMAAMNARVKLERVPETRVAAAFLKQELALPGGVREDSLPERLGRHTREHLGLVALSLGAAVVVAIPLGVLAARRPRSGQVILAAAGVIQTIPALALLVFMIPILGIGGPPAVVALFLYSLLPIIRNTCTGLTAIPGPIRLSAEALGLPRAAQLRLIELPLAAPSILAGIKTSAVINVGTATLGALIGAGGYGQPILTGIRLDDVGLILEGAVPAALMALAVQVGFELIERALVPKGLRVQFEYRS